MVGKNARVIGIFTLAMINLAAIASLRGLPSMAEYGFSSAFYYILAAIAFFIPVAFVAAELATGWPKKGGIYAWVKEAFGPRWGFVAIWLQWIQNVVFYPTVLSFTAATLAFAFNPSLAENALYTLGIILVVYWGATLANFRGMKTSGWISTIGVAFGLVIPGALLILLGVTWFFSGNPLQVDFSWNALIPDMSNIHNIVFAAGILLAFGGLEMSAVHAREVKDPSKDYPKAIFVSVIIILIIFILGTLSIAAVVPQEKISLVAGIMEAFSDFLNAYNLAWLVPVIAVMIAIGAVGQVGTWIVGPSKGLLATAEEGDLPPFFQKINKNGMPVHVMIVQGCIVSALALILILEPSVSNSFWMLTSLTAQLYLIMYLLLFFAGIKLKYSQPNVKRAYSVPGGKAGMWIVAGIGIIAAIAGISLLFFPPAQLHSGNELLYDGFLAVGIIVLGGAPLLIYHLRKPSWKPKGGNKYGIRKDKHKKAKSVRKRTR